MKDIVYVLFTPDKNMSESPFQALEYIKDDISFFGGETYMYHKSRWQADSLSELKLKMLIESGDDTLLQNKDLKIRKVFFTSIMEDNLKDFEEA